MTPLTADERLWAAELDDPLPTWAAWSVAFIAGAGCVAFWLAVAWLVLRRT